MIYKPDTKVTDSQIIQALEASGVDDNFRAFESEIIAFARALLSMHIPAAQASCEVCNPVRCVICCSEEPRTGTCGSDDPRALCNLPAPEPVSVPELPNIENIPRYAPDRSGFQMEQCCDGMYVLLSDVQDAIDAALAAERGWVK